MKKYFIFSALVAACSTLVCAIFFFSCLALHINPLGGVKGIGYIPMIMSVFLGLHLFRKMYLNNILHFHQAFVLGLLIHTFTCLFFATFLLIYLNTLGENVLDQHRLESIRLLEFLKEDVGKEKYSLAKENFKTLSVQSVVTHDLIWRFGLLLFIVFIASFIMRRSPSWALSK